MRLGAIALGGAALALVAGAFVLALTSRPGGAAPQAPAIVTTTLRSAPVTATPRATAKLGPAGKKRARSSRKTSCKRDGDATGSDSGSCGSGDDQAGDRNTGDNSGDEQAGDMNSGDSSSDDQAGEGDSGDTSGDEQAGDGKAGGS